MKIYVDELPKSCSECEFCGKLKPPAKRPEVECMHCNMMKKMDKVSEHCPLVEFDRQECCILGDKRMSYKELYFNSIEESKKQFKGNRILKTRWENLKNFITNRPYCAGYEVQTKLILDILDKMGELEKEDKDEE